MSAEDALSGAALLASLATALQRGRIRVLDLTQTLTPDFPQIALPPELGQCWPFRVEEVSHYDERGPAWYWNNFSCGEHTGTHFDAPIHWISGKDLPNNSVDTIAAQNFVAPACVIDCHEQARANPDYLMSVADIEAFEASHGRIVAGSWVLMRTDWSKRSDPEVYHLQPPYPCHSLMHGSGRFGQQCLCNLDQLPPTGSLLICPPLKIEKGSGSPLRVLALVAA